MAKPQPRKLNLEKVNFVLGVLCLLLMGYMMWHFSPSNVLKSQMLTPAEVALGSKLSATAAARPSPATISQPKEAAQKANELPKALSQPWFKNIRKIAAVLDPDIMQRAPPADSQSSAAYNESFRSPCWHAGGQLWCMPAVYLMGSFQAGATTLYNKLIAMPDIITNEGSRWQFWAENAKKFGDYLEMHRRSVPELQRQPGGLLLDASSSTFAFYWSAGLRAHAAFQDTMVPCWRNCSETNRAAAAKDACMDRQCYRGAMAHDRQVAKDLNIEFDMVHNPLIMSALYGSYTPKFIVLLRDPVDRLHSAFWQYNHYKKKYGESEHGFLAYVEEQVGALQNCQSKGFSDVECVLYFEALGVEEEQLFFHADQIIRGMYSVFLERWLRFFPRSSFLIIRSEQYFLDQDSTLDEIYEFLQFPAPTDPDIISKIRNAGHPVSFTRGKPAMLRQARKLLADFYKPYNEQLSQLLDDKAYLAWSQV